MQPSTEAAYGRLVSRMVFTTDDDSRADAAPAALLSLAQIVALVEKRLRWYGFREWRVRDILCHHGPTVSVEIRGPAGAALTLTLHRDCGRLRNVLLQDVLPVSAVPSPEAAPAVHPAAEAAARACVTPHIAHERRLTPQIRGEVPDEAARLSRLSGMPAPRRVCQGRTGGKPGMSRPQAWR